MGRMIRVSKKSKGAEKRLYKAVRLMILYSYKADNQCWRKKTRERYKKAWSGMRLLVMKMVIKLLGDYNYWTCEPVHSRSVTDLVADRNLAFLICVSNYEDMT